LQGGCNGKILRSQLFFVEYMKVFISHQKADSVKAAQVAQHLRTRHAIDSYLDVVDPKIGTHEGPELADHVREQMDKCDSLLAVVSYETAKSQWVPWEIGIATEKEFPLATYADTYLPLPEFLQKWPYITSISELDKYADAVNKMVGRSRSAILAKGISTESFNQSNRATTRDFYRNLRATLGR
jgi:nucleoside 2-deoxyribosyltransferase